MGNRKIQGGRRSIRLSGYDYAQPGLYFVTLCTYRRGCVLGDIANETMELSGFGQIVHGEWLRSSEIRDDINLDAFQIIPNHLHAIVTFSYASSDSQPVGAHSRAPFSRQPRSLGSLVAGFKSATTKRINQIRNTPGVSVWQRNYYERVIRDEEELAAVRQYIADNPAKWAEDSENPRNRR